MLNADDHPDGNTKHNTLNTKQNKANSFEL